MPKSRSNSSTKDGLLKRLDPTVPKPPLVLNKNTRKLLEQVEPPAPKKKKK